MPTITKFGSTKYAGIQTYQGSIEVAADVYAEAVIPLGHKFDCTILSIDIIYNATTLANLAVNDKFQCQICRDLAAMGSLANNQIYWKDLLMVPIAIAAQTACLIDLSRHFPNVKIKMKNTDSISIGGIMPEAGYLEYKIVVSLNDISY